IHTAPQEIRDALIQDFQQRMREGETSAKRDQALLNHLDALPKGIEHALPENDRWPLLGQMIWKSRERVKYVGAISRDSRLVFGVIEDHRGYEASRIFAFDTATGAVCWKSRISWWSWFSNDVGRMDLGKQSLSPGGR